MALIVGFFDIESKIAFSVQELASCRLFYRLAYSLGVMVDHTCL